MKSDQTNAKVIGHRYLEASAINCIGERVTFWCIKISSIKLVVERCHVVTNFIGHF